MLKPLLRRFRSDSLRTRVEESIRRGTGLSKQEWVLSAEPLQRADMETLSGSIVEWCRDRISQARRPYGIDQMALAIACAVPGGPPLASTTFGVFRPLEFYAEDGVSDRIQQYLLGLSLDELNQRTGPMRIAAALFSWGDVARDTIFADD